MRFQIQITETLQRSVDVDAKTVKDAETIVRKQYRSGQIVLDSFDFTGVDFTACASQKEPIA